MVAVIQRVKASWVKRDDEEIAKIAKGLNILLGVVKGDRREDGEKLAKKIVNMRIFPNEEGKMDRSVLDIGGEILVVSQFTLAGVVKRGNRPDFSDAMPATEARRLYEEFIAALTKYLFVQKGEFGAMMEVGIINDGPVTLVIDSKKL